MSAIVIAVSTSNVHLVPALALVLVVVEEIHSFYVKYFEYPEKRYINVINYYYYYYSSHKLDWL